MHIRVCVDLKFTELQITKFTYIFKTYRQSKTKLKETFS